MFDGPWQSCMGVGGLDPGQCASWVQAWGTILAIAAAALAVLYQVRSQADLQAKSKRENDVQLLGIIGMFIFEARAKLTDTDQSEIAFMRTDWTAVEAPIAAIRSVALDRYPADRVAFEVAQALLSYDFMRDAYKKVGNSLGTPEQVAHVDKSRAFALANLMRAEAAVEAALVARDSKLQRQEVDFGNGIRVRTLEKDPVS